jgi:hypothetical protein
VYIYVSRMSTDVCESVRTPGNLQCVCVCVCVCVCMCVRADREWFSTVHLDGLGRGAVEHVPICV